MFSNASCQGIQYMKIYFASTTPFTSKTRFRCFVERTLKISVLEGRINICPKNGLLFMLVLRNSKPIYAFCQKNIGVQRSEEEYRTWLICVFSFFVPMLLNKLLKRYENRNITHICQKKVNNRA